MPQNKQFSYKNYFRPTPKNIQQLLLSLKAVVATAALTTYAMASEKVGFFILLGGAALGELANFFGRVAEETESQVVKVEYPAAVADQVIVTTETKASQELPQSPEA